MPTGKHAQVLAAVPVGHRVARRGDSWLRALQRSDELASCRKDQKASILTVATFLAAARRYEHQVLRPGLSALLLASEGRSERTVYRVLQWLRDRRWIGHVQRGSTEQYRGAGDVHGVGNLSAEFVLILKNVSPNGSLLQRGFSPSTRTRVNSENEPLSGRPSSRPPVGGNSKKRPEEGTDHSASWPGRQIPRGRLEMLRATRSLQARLPDLRRISTRRLRAQLRPWFLAGWSPADVHHALDHTPGGVPHTYGGAGHTVRHPGPWLDARLALWSTDAGEPAPSHRERTIEAADTERARNAARRAEVIPDRAGAARPSFQAAAMAAIGAILRPKIRRT